MPLTEDTIVNQVKNMPSVRRFTLPAAAGGLGLNDAALGRMVAAHVMPAFNEVLLSYDWDFAMREHTDTSVANTADYECTGENNDCLRVATVKWGSDETLLIKMTMAAIDDIKRRATISTVRYWIEIENSDQNFPQIRIIDTPAAAKDILYRYWRNDITLAKFPGQLDFLFASAVAKRLGVIRISEFGADLNRAIRLYTRGGGEVDVAVKDQAIANAHQRRAALHGWNT